MKINWKSLGITLALLLVLSVVVMSEIGMFISGPARKYEGDVAEQEARIKKKYTQIKELDRHVFYYTTYVGEDDDTVVWFNEVGKVIVTRKKKTLRTDEVKQKAAQTYHAKNIKVSLGYGYDNPVYVIECDMGSILLDYDTLKEVYFLQEGEI